MFISILGRQPELGAAELEQIYGAKAIEWFSPTTVLVDTSSFDFERLGGSQKSGRVIFTISRGDWRAASMKIVRYYTEAFARVDYKITLGISTYGFDVSVRDIQKTGIILKQKLREKNVSLRLLPNAEPALNTAASHHNKLGLSQNKVELLVVRSKDGQIIVAESVGAQNITALAARDQARPHTDAFVGMLPPKLARMMVNLASNGRELPSGESSLPVVLDPFCGTGVVLQEAALLGYSAYGTDLSEKMVDYTTKNLDWLHQKYPFKGTITVEYGDAMTHRWNGQIDAVVCESYLGQPFSAPPSPAKLTEVRGNCNHIISEFLHNISAQLAPGTPICLAVPAWRDVHGRFTHLPFISQIGDFGLERRMFKSVRDSELLYYRENQVVARELLILVKR